MLDIKAVKNVLKKRQSRGAIDEQLVIYLEGLKAGSWKRFPEDIDRLIDEIKKETS